MTRRFVLCTSRWRAGRFGTAFVDAFARDWGVCPFPPSGKTLWAEIAPERGGGEQG
ncbi:hypothetical protein [Streptomyces sp. NBC_01185]|uniref:hypothetical protein n=1 Tax=Streptomyces sp. NBC_01185 TaxID=2903764 RepID=UPI00386CA4B0|nr:hypothetical protein OG770_29030 [Streptomyces sp. NBC_01185]